MKIARFHPFDAGDLLPALAVALAYAALAFPVRHSIPVWGSGVLASALIALSIIDIKTFRLPDILTLPLIITGIALAGYFGWDTLDWRTASAAIGFGTAAGVAWLYEAVRGRAGLGLGDAKLFAASGAWTGAEGLVTVLLYACISALLAMAVASIRSSTLTKTTAIPFGPFIAAGTWLVWLYGPLT